MKKQTMSFIAGALTSAVLFSGGAAYAAGIMAEHAPQTAYVDGRSVHLDAYNIGGCNYVKIRDIGQAVGFNVYWDGKSIQMNTDAPYTGNAPTQSVPSIWVDSRKGRTLTVGERSTLLTEPRDTASTAVSSNPAVISVENVGGYWVAVAQAEGNAVVTIRNSSGAVGQISLTVRAKSSTPDDSSSDNTASAPSNLTANMEIRQEMIRLINEVRRENGVPDLPVNAALMDAAQAISGKMYTTHHNQEEVLTARSFGYSYGFKSNLTKFAAMNSADIARQAVSNWINSPGHFQAMIAPNCDCVGVGVTMYGKTAFCYMFAGVPNSSTMYG